MWSVVLGAALVLAGQEPAGPIDAFKANYMAIKAEVDFECWFGEDIEPWQFARAKAKGVQALGDAVHLCVVGSWARDGSAEYRLYGLPNHDNEKEREPARACGVPWTTLSEGIYEGTLSISHYFEVTSPNPNTEVIRGGKPGIDRLYGPFNWFVDPFPECLEQYVPGARPVHRIAVRDGRTFDVEVYEGREERHGYPNRVELWYDASIGYLPRYARGVIIAGDSTAVELVTLLGARPCATGGFVPTEWHRILYDMPSKEFAKRYPHYDIETVMEPPRRWVINYFKARDVRDRAEPVALVKLDGVKRFDLDGRSVPLPPNTKKFTMADAKRIMGRLGARVPVSGLPDLSRIVDTGEVGELQGFSRGGQGASWSNYFAGALLVALVAYLVWWRRNRRKARVALLLAFALLMHGCGKAGPAIKLSARFAEKTFLYEPFSGPVHASIEVFNEGRQTLRLVRADGGCACRKVDQLKFPATLRPGGLLAVDVEFMPAPAPPAQMFPLILETDHGTIYANPSCYPLPTHQINPASIALALDENEETETFDLVHRAIFRADGPAPAAELEVPRGFSVTRGDSERKSIGFARAFSYADTVYHVTLQCKEPGLKREVVRLEDSGGRRILVVPVTWNRRPFLSSFPDRVVLGARPVRVVLCCRDKKVEMTKILKAPPGITARLTSPRELTVAPANSAPEVIDGQVEVSTTASGRPPLKIPVVRYAPAHPTGRS